MASVAEYADRARGFGARREEQARVSLRISRLRLVTFLPAAALVVWSASRGFTPVPVAAATGLFVIFAVLVVRHARVEERMAWLEALRTVADRAAARLTREWSRLPRAEAPAALDLEHHPYALDLDLFGRASLYQWIGPAATPHGGAALAAWLLAPAERPTVLARQRAAAELSRAEPWREAFAAHGVLAAAAGEAQIRTFLRWAEGDDPLGPRAPLIGATAVVIVLSIWVLLVLYAWGLLAAAVWLVPLLAGVVLSFVLTPRLTMAFDRAGGGEQALRGYAALLEHVASAPRSAPLLEDIHRRLSADGVDAAVCMRRLDRILGFANLRRSAAIFHFLIQAFTLWDFHVAYFLERWRRACGPAARTWLQALGELDALSLLAGIQHDNPEWCTPELTETPLVEATALGHPLIADGRRVANDVSLGPPGTLLLVTGSNMSGKSTLLRAIGLNTVLAQAGAAACARRLRLPPLDLQTSIRVQDSLELGMSYFMAALARLKGVVDAAEHERPGRVLLYLLDEILQGTNSAERSIAVRAVARHLLQARAIGAMTTHDLTLAEAEPFRTAAVPVHFTEIVDGDGTMRFDYLLRPGIATSRNALRLMEKIGIKVTDGR